MNCRDITDILDNRNIACLQAAERQEMEAHLAACPECARDLALQQGFAALPDSAMPTGFAARCRARVAEVPRPRWRGHANHRRLRLGAFAAAAMAAAAALLLLLWPGMSTENPESGERTVASGGTLPASDTTGVAGETAELPREVVPAEFPAPSFTLRVLLPGEEEMIAAATPSMPEISERQKLVLADPASRRSLEAFHAALLDELRTVPGLTLLGRDTEVSKDPAAKNYQLKIGLLFMAEPDGTVNAPDGRNLDIMWIASQRLPDGSLALRMQEGARIVHQPTCTGGGRCGDAAGIAADLVRTLREKVFPRDPSVPRMMQARLQDASLLPDERFQALLDLFKLQAQSSDNSLLRDPAALRAALDLAAIADPPLRARIWVALRGVAHPDLLQPLLNSALQDADNVRLEAAVTLADFSDDPRGRAALEMVARDDPWPLVRAVAARGLSGEEGWHRYVAASLQDTSRTPRERIEALSYHVYPPDLAPGVVASKQGSLQVVLDDEAALRALTEVLPAVDMLPGYGGSPGLMISNVGYIYNKHPAVTDMLLHYLERGNSRNRTIAGEVLARTHGSDARVREALKKTLESDPDPKVRDWIRQVMGANAP
jgi:hypothetical protein